MLKSLAPIFLTIAFAAAPLCASTTVLVTLDTSSLPSQPYDLYFDLIDGSGTGDGNNTVTLSNFSCPSCPSGPIALTDTQFFQDSTNPVTLGSQLQFTLNFTTNVDAGGTPDSFEFQLLNADAIGGPTAIATTDPVTGEDLLNFDIDSLSPTINVYDSADTNFPFPAPQIVSVPEPGGIAPLCFGAFFLMLSFWKRRAAAALLSRH